MTITSKAERKGLNALVSAASGPHVQMDKNTFFKTYCYAPIDGEKTFATNTNATIEKLASECDCGSVFNYRNGGNFYAFPFNDETLSPPCHKHNSRHNQLWQIV